MAHSRLANFQHLLSLHEAQAHAAWAHAAICRRCHHPIIDYEWNPGYQSEACSEGARILRRLIELDGALLHLAPGDFSPGVGEREERYP